MFDLVSSLLLAIWPHTPEIQPVMNANLSEWVNSIEPTDLLMPLDRPDPMAVKAVKQHVEALNTTWGFPVDQQGIWIQSGRHVLAKHQGTEPLPAASLTKIATTLVALKTWGIDYQFETLISYRGTVQDGVLNGDLVVNSSGDPLFVWEEAIAVGNAINQAGIQTVTGDLVISDSFTMNFEEDAEESGTLLRRGMNASLWNWEAQEQYAAMAPNTPRPSVDIQGSVRVQNRLRSSNRESLRADATILDAMGILFNGGASGLKTISHNTGEPTPMAQEQSDQVPLLLHRSVPLIEMLRQMNIYSNNFMAEALANGVGGADRVAKHAAQMTGVPEDEIQLINGSGLGVENRISARAACAMLVFIQGTLQQSNWTVADVLPVMGLDEGTIQDRDLPKYSAVKTGTLNTVSALAGAIPNDDPNRDVVWFAMINWGSYLDGMRDHQDILLQELELNHPTGGAIARQEISGNEELELGAPQRNQLLIR